MPLFGVDVLGLSVGQIGALLTGMAVVNLALLPSASTLADRFGRVRVIVPATLGMAVALALMAIAHSVPGFLVGSGRLALATSISGPAPAALAADAVPAESRGFALGLFRTVGDLGLLVGPPALGLVADIADFGGAFGANAVVVALITAVFIWAAAGRERRAS